MVEEFKYYKKAQAIREEKLGKEHPETARTYSNIATVFFEMGDCKEAMVYYQKALEINERIFGEDHPDTAANYGTLLTATVFRTVSSLSMGKKRSG